MSDTKRTFSLSFDGFHLKLVAILAMLMNHIGHTFEFSWNPPVWEFFYLTIGKLTFPIMAFLMIEGFHYTHNRWKYGLRLAIFSLLSYIPYANLFWMDAWPGNNILFTLLMGLILISLCEEIPYVIVQLLLVAAFIVLTYYSDWNLFGIPIIYLLYKTYGHPKTYLLLFLFVALVKILVTYWLTYSFLNPINLASNLGLLLVAPFLQHYNGQRGYSPAWVKWGFYLFYPLHLTILWGLRLLILGY